MLCLITYKVRSENGYGFFRPGLETGMGNGRAFWPEIGSGFGDAGGTPPPKIPRSTPPPRAPSLAKLINICIARGTFPTAWKQAKVTPIHKQKSN